MSPIVTPDSSINSEETSKEHLDEGQNLYDQPPFIDFTQKLTSDYKFTPNNIYAAMTVITEILERDLRNDCDMNAAIRNYNNLTPEEKEERINGIVSKIIYAQRKEVLSKTSRELQGVSLQEKITLFRSVINYLMQDVYQIFYIKEQLADAKHPIDGRYHHSAVNKGFGIPTFACWKVRKETDVNKTPVPENLEGLGPDDFVSEPTVRQVGIGYQRRIDVLASSEIVPNTQTN